jgi:HK97 family phage portal protein
MNFWQKLFGRNKTGLQSTEFTFTPVEVSALNKRQIGCSVATSSVDKLSKAIASTVPIAVTKDKTLDNVKSLDLLNNFSFRYEIMQRINDDLHWGGRSFVMFVGNVKSVPSKIVHIDASKVSFMNDENDEISQIMINRHAYAGTFTRAPDTDKKRAGRFISSDNLKEVIVIETIDGLPILKAVENEITVLSQSIQRNGALVQNGGRLSMLISYKDSVDAEEMSRRSTAINQAVRGKGYGGILATGEADITEFGLRPRDMDFEVLATECRKNIYSAIGIPLALVDGASATFSNVASSQATFYLETVMPAANYIYSKLGAVLTAREGLEFDLVTDSASIDSIKMKQFETAKVMTESKSVTINEIRKELGFEEMQGDGYGEVLVEARLVPADALGVVK